jgi:hydroxypyruvate isomerase
MKITKTQLQQIIMEETQTLINEQSFVKKAANLGKKAAGAAAGVAGAVGKAISGDEKEEADDSKKGQPKSDVKKATGKLGTALDKVSGLEAILDKINTRQEFEQMLGEMIRTISKNVKAQDITTAVRNVYGKLNKEMEAKEE